MARENNISGTHSEWHHGNRPRRYRLATNALAIEVSPPGLGSKRALLYKVATNTLSMITKALKVARKGLPPIANALMIAIRALTPVSAKGLLIWGGLIAALSLPLASIARYNWWLLLIFGVVLPIALGIANRIAGSYNARVRSHSINHHSEQELLEVLERYKELTPLTAATKTSLTVTEADKMLSEFAQKGYLEVRIDGGRMSYAL